MKLFVDDNELTNKEKEVRDWLIYSFNPSLKFCLYTFGKENFIKYGYNSCRQTAIFTAFILDLNLPSKDYKVKVFEGTFDDRDKSQSYKHAFTILYDKNKNRKILVDLSRTEKLLSFNTFTDISYPYPKHKSFQNMKFIYAEELNWKKLIYDESISEFVTGMNPLRLINIILSHTESIKNTKGLQQKDFAEAMYKQFTQINDIKE